MTSTSTSCDVCGQNIPDTESSFPDCLCELEAMAEIDDALLQELDFNE